MILKRFSFMLMGSAVLSTALLLGACGDSSSSSGTNEDDELGEVQVKAKSSSSSKKKTSSSSSDTSAKDAEDPSDLKESKSLEAPSNVTLSRLAPSVWELTFSYEGKNAESFVVQRYAPGNKSWEEYDEIDAEMTHFLIDGEKNGGYYYRLAAKNDETRSSYTKELFVSEDVGYAEGIKLTPPTAKPNVSEENVLELVLTGNYPSKSITKSIYNKDSKGKTVGSVSYEARFVTGTEKSVDTVKVSVDQSSISKTFKSVEEQCNAYAQIRVVWTDKNGVSDYGEWSDPMGTKAGTNSNLIDADKRCESKGTSDDGEDSGSKDDNKIAFAVPSNLTVKNQDVGTWMLEWAYKPVEARPEKGFIIQKLDLDKSKWENFDTTGTGVYRAMITGLTDPYNYFRVAAFDDDGKSEFSADILIAVSEADAEVLVVNPPTNLAIARIAPGVWELSWKYDVASDNPERKFIIQSSKLKDFEWTDVETDIVGNVRYYHIQGRDKIETYYRMAVVDKGDTSAFTEAVQLTPEIPYREYMALNVPVPSMSLSKYYTTAYEVDQDTATKEDVTYVHATVTFTITSNFISKYIVESEYTDVAYYEARWFTSLEHYNDYKNINCEGKKTSDGCDSCYWDEQFPYEEPSITKGAYKTDIYKLGDSIEVMTEDGTQKIRIDTSVSQYCKAHSGYDASNHYKLYLPSAEDIAMLLAAQKENEGDGEGEEDDDGDDEDNPLLDIETVTKAEWQRIMDSEVAMSECLAHNARSICGYYVQLRIVWKDRNGETDWSEWTQPYSVSSIDSDFCNN